MQPCARPLAGSALGSVQSSPGEPCHACFAGHEAGQILKSPTAVTLSRGSKTSFQTFKTGPDRLEPKRKDLLLLHTY